MASLLRPLTQRYPTRQAWPEVFFWGSSTADTLPLKSTSVLVNCSSIFSWLLNLCSLIFFLVQLFTNHPFKEKMSFHTDRPEVAPCDRNNCRCGDNTNCMYYNSAGPGQSHYNYTAVQGAGDPSSPMYRCSSKAMDYYNRGEMYGDHAMGGMGGYNEEQGASLQGTINFNDKACSEHSIGKRDMCDQCHVDRPSYVHRRGLMDRGMQSTVLGLPLWVWLAIAAVGMFAAARAGKLNLSDRKTQIFIAVAFAVVWLLFFF